MAKIKAPTKDKGKNILYSVRPLRVSWKGP